MTTPASSQSVTAPRSQTASQNAAIAAIARHITGRQPGDEHDALLALGVDEADARAITGT